MALSKDDLLEKLKAGIRRSHRPPGIMVLPKALRTHNVRLLGPKIILYEAFGLFGALGLSWGGLEDKRAYDS